MIDSLNELKCLQSVIFYKIGLIMKTKMQQPPELQPFNKVMDVMTDDESSLTLTIGSECLDQFFNNAAMAVSSFPNHATEIGLASLCRRLNEMQLTDEVEGLFKHVLELIQINDQAMSA